MQTFKLHQVSATVGLDYDINNKIAEPKWQLESSVGRVLDVQATAAGCTLSKNWDADLGAMSCNVEVRGHCSWSGRVRAASPATPPAMLPHAHTSTDCVPAADAVDRLRAHPHGDQGCHGRRRVRSGEVAGREPARQARQAACQGGTPAALLSRLGLADALRFAQVEVGASIYKEGAELSDASAKDDVLCLKIKSVNAIVTL